MDALGPEDLKATTPVGPSSGDRTPGARLDREFAGYQILDELGRGGMGVVYKAYDPELKRTVALKVLLSAEHASEEEIKRFFREAESAAKLQHPNIVPIHELKVHEGKHYYTMDYIEGQPLDGLIREKRVDLREGAEIIRKAAGGLEHAHAHGVVHRDLKPANIIVGADGEPKILDFGLAKVLGGREGPGAAGELTRSGAAMGTPYYMAPEQAAGRSRDVDARTDVYAVGCILYQLLTGVPPFVDENAMEVIRSQVEEDPPAPRTRSPQVPAELEVICLKCLAKEPDRRYQSAGELAEDLRRFLAGEPITARPASVLYRVRKRLARNLPATIIAAAAVAVLGALAVGWMVFSPGDRPDPRLEIPEAVKQNPVRLTAMKSNVGWTITFQVMDPKLKEIFYRLGEAGDFESTGHSAVTNQMTGLPVPNYHVTVPLSQKGCRVFVKYTDKDGGEHGPYELGFDPLKETLRSTKQIMRITATVWVGMRDYDGKLLLYFSHLLSYRDALEEIRYSLGEAKLDRTFPLPPPDPQNRILGSAKTYLEIPRGTQVVYVQLTYRDGTKSKVRSFKRQ
jgi:serine/threonine-protein kinase